ncbi:MAG: HAD-IC family P-type ATPase [Telluria sp.]
MRDARQSIRERRLDIDVLMIVAALGAAAWGQWTEGALLLVLFSLGAASVGISDVRAGLLPEEKLKVIDELMQAHGQVAMVGDGVNDAPAMARATIGIAMGGAGTDVALETADVALMADDLSRLPFAISLSGASHRIIRQNLWAAFGVVALLIPATLFGWASMGIAVLIHEGATVLVVLNALRLLRFADVQE